MADITPAQYKAIVIVPCVSATISIICSSLIIHRILSDFNNKFTKIHHRILFFMSVMDIIQSIASGLSTFPAPRDSPALYAFGNTMTCNMQGFMTQLGHSVGFYNCALSLHYVLRIRYRVTEQTMRAKVEPFMHLLALGWPLASSIVGLHMNLYNFGGNRCWINSYPFGCADSKEITCTRGLNANEYRWYFIGIWMFLWFFWIPCCNLLVYITVKNQENKMRRRFNQNMNSNQEQSPRAPPSLLTLPGFISSNRNSRMYEETGVFTSIAVRTKQTATQCFLYSLSIYVNASFPVILRMVEQFAGRLPFSLIILAQIFYPLQGFFNFLIYIRPQVLRIKKRNGNKSYIWALRKAIFTQNK